VVVRDPVTKAYQQVVLLDLHVAKSESEGGGPDAVAGADVHEVTGKTLFMSLRLSEAEPRHTVGTDLESLFYR
jgi:hypothetical protein